MINIIELITAIGLKEDQVIQLKKLHGCTFRKEPLRDELWKGELFQGRLFNRGIASNNGQGCGVNFYELTDDLLVGQLLPKNG